MTNASRIKEIIDAMPSKVVAMLKEKVKNDNGVL